MRGWFSGMRRFRFIAAPAGTQSFLPRLPCFAAADAGMSKTILLSAAFVALALFASAQPARADFRLCNNTASRVGVAIGYKDADGWTTEGWWNLPARKCETLLKGNLVARYYYIYAVDYDRGGEWMGQAIMCTRDKEFTIRGIGDCLARGYDRTGFFEVDTGEQRAWTVQLTETSEQAPQQPLTPGNPLSRRAPSASAPAAPPPRAPAAPGS
jgi:uncharacterized membrane protein